MDCSSQNWSTVSLLCYCSPFFSVYVWWWGHKRFVVRSILFLFSFFFPREIFIRNKSERIDRNTEGIQHYQGIITRELSLYYYRLRFRFEQSQVWSREKRYIFIFCVWHRYKCADHRFARQSNNHTRTIYPSLERSSHRSKIYFDILRALLLLLLSFLLTFFLFDSHCD